MKKGFAIRLLRNNPKSSNVDEYSTKYANFRAATSQVSFKNGRSLPNPFPTPEV